MINGLSKNIRPVIGTCAKAFLLMLVALSLSDRPDVRAHDSPENQIQALTARMAKSGKTVSLLMRRAVEYKALGDLDKAAADLTEAIALEPKGPAAYADLSRLQLAQGKLSESCDNATR